MQENDTYMAINMASQLVAKVGSRKIVSTSYLRIRSLKGVMHAAVYVL